jgi:superfamily II DNA or RNA helicase
LKSGVDGKLSLTLSDGIYVDTMNIQPAVQNQIRRMAAVSNPVFYKNMAMGLSNYDNARWIYMGKEHLSGYIEIPRGLYDELTEQCRKAGITYEITDERQPGRRIKAEFTGQLRPEQEPALEEMLRYDTGILNAATAFGKTVVCSAMIAARKVNTLILLESSSLIEQWEEALNSFLKIEEETPEYQTKTGRIRRRKSIIGKLQGAHDSMTGIIDIAMVGSLCKKGEFHEKLNDYGMVLVDECHHAASNTMANILNQVNARYVYGVTATPMRGDGLEKITYMLLGPIRYRYTAKAKAEEVLKELVEKEKIWKNYQLLIRFYSRIREIRKIEKIYMDIIMNKQDIISDKQEFFYEVHQYYMSLEKAYDAGLIYTIWSNKLFPEETALALEHDIYIGLGMSG